MEIMRDVLHPNQTAYLTNKQIQDNLRLINTINQQFYKTIIVALDARKAFDSVNHDYIRRVLIELGLENFVPIFNLLYKDQTVDIAVNGDVVQGYSIKNGVKQGDALSFILFIICLDPLIRNVEHNDKIERVFMEDIVPPKLVAYADDITCFVDNKQSLKHIFKEYERLSAASCLVLNAEKTEILDGINRTYKIKYLNNLHYIRGLTEAKINGVLFAKDGNYMKARNYEALVEKVGKALAMWEARKLSLLGKILILKTFGLSQLIYILTVIELEQEQYKKLERMFLNFLWGRDIQRERVYNRISREKLSRPVEMGGFGMIDFKEVIDGIHCKQLCKMFGEEYSHPLKFCIKNDQKSFASGKCLKTKADEVSQKAQ
jgi:hypothetical protein